MFLHSCVSTPATPPSAPTVTATPTLRATATDKLTNPAPSPNMLPPTDTTGPSSTNHLADPSPNPTPPEQNNTSSIQPPPQAPTAHPSPMNPTEALQVLSQFPSQIVEGQNAQQAVMQSQFQQLSAEVSTLPASVTSNLSEPSPGQGSAVPPANNLFNPASTANASAAMSLPSFFPDIDEATLLKIGGHTFEPGHISKLVTCIKDKVENGVPIQCEREPSMKEYPTWQSLYNPFALYITILQVHLSISGNLTALRQVIIGCNTYLCTLYDLYMEYDRTALLDYHFAFHASRLTDMAKGDYSRWGEIDDALKTHFLIGHPRIRWRARCGSTH